MPDIIRIKPHHFLDIIKVFGAGGIFKPHPYGHAVHMVAEKVLKDSNIVLELVLGADDICQPCIHNKDGICVDITTTPGVMISKESWNRTIDRRLFERLNLEEGTRISASEFCLVTQEHLGNIYDVWREAPPDQTADREKNLMRGLALISKRN